MCTVYNGQTLLTYEFETVLNFTLNRLQISLQTKVSEYEK